MTGASWLQLAALLALLAVTIKPVGLYMAKVSGPEREAPGDRVFLPAGLERVPIIVLSARGAEHDKVEALDAGADDYVAKPFGMDELLARVRAAVRRATPAAEEAVVQTDDFTIDLGAKTISARSGEAIKLTPTEWQLLEALVRRRGRLVSSRQLLRDVWGPGYGEESNYLRVHMAHLRAKLEPQPSRPRYLMTEPGMGYRFAPAP